jgi:uncharacterized phage-associated protein
MRLRVIDLADYILESRGPMSAMKLQKLAYYCQAWVLVWADKELFPDRIEAWANGPVVRSLYAKHRGEFRLRKGFFGGETERVVGEQKRMIDKVLSFYGDKDPQWLSNLTHMEQPWLDARKGLAPGERGDREISKAAMQEYYASL